MAGKPILIFDYDGTLHETMYIYKPGVQEAVRWLNEEQGLSVAMPDDARISSWLGMNTQDMWQDFLPGIPMEMKMKAGRMVGDVMLEGLRTGRARWYSGADRMLDRLREDGYTMAVLSNCGEDYGAAHWKHFQMGRWFSAFFTSETYSGMPKHEILKIIAGDFEAAWEQAPARTDKLSERDRENIACGEYRMAGDRGSDLRSAEAIRAPMIGCLYGYGSRQELEGSAKLVESVREISFAVEELSNEANQVE